MVVATSDLHIFEHDVNHNHEHIVRKKSALAGVSPAEHAQSTAKDLIRDALHQRIEAINHELCEPGDEDTFFVADLGEVYRQHLRWVKQLPRIKPHYAVKCNPDPNVLRLLSKLGTGFDCASKGEIEQVLAMGISPERIIYAQPCKTNSYVRFVKSCNVRQMTFDNGDELHKIAKLFPGAELFLRIMTDDASSLCRLSMKFGAPMDTTDDLLALAQKLGLNVVGVSFHVGSGASDPMAFYKAVRDADAVFQSARRCGFDLRTLDVGGGFTSDTFETMAGALDAALADFFPPSRGVELIAEPGRFYVATVFTIACNIIARRTVQDPAAAAVTNAAAADAGRDSQQAQAAQTAPNAGYMVYVNDGVYGNFSSIMFDHQHPVAKVLRSRGHTLYNHPSSAPVSPSAAGAIEYSIWGPTCDGIDRISESTHFRHVLDVGDWLYFEDMGAYTKCSATQFNGFSNSHETIYVCSEQGARKFLL